MATNTQNYNMVKPGIDDDALIADLNGNTDIIDAEMRAIRDNIAIVVNGNTAPRAISAGQYLFIKNNSSLSAGGYHATANIANGATITSSNVTADADGVVNGAFATLNSKITNPNDPLFGHIKNEVADANNFKAGWTYALSTSSNLPSAANYFVLTFLNDNVGAQVAIRRNNGGYMYFRKKNDGIWDSWYQVNASVVS